MERYLLTQPDLFARPAGAINRIHQLEGLVAFLAGHERLAAILDRIAEVAELAFEGLDRDRHGIRGAGGYLLRYRSRLARIVFYVPGGELVAGDDGGALGSVEFGALGIAGPKCGGRLD